MMPISKFLAFNQENDLFSTHERILLAVSGGKDSVLMAHLFHQAGLKFAVAHCNFALRGAESDADEEFVRSLANSFSAPFFSIKFDTSAHAEKEKISTQMAARYLRYQWFEELAMLHHFDKIGLAQHQNDVAETLLINLCRGTGIAGLHGILPIRGKLMRPILFLNTEEISDIIHTENIAYVEDSSNSKTDYHRNKIRHLALPILQEINPKAVQNFNKTAQHLKDVEAILQQYISQIKAEIGQQKTDGYYIDIEKILKLNPNKTILYEIIKAYGFSFEQAAALLQRAQLQSGAQYFSEQNILTIDRKYFIIHPLKNETAMEVQIGEKDFRIDFSSHQFIISQNRTPQIIPEKNTIGIDAAQLIFPLTLRFKKNGDKIKPLGMKGLKKISDVFIDLKIPLSQKNNIPLLINADGNIIWIVGILMSDEFKISSNTKKMTTFEMR